MGWSALSSLISLVRSRLGVEMDASRSPRPAVDETDKRKRVGYVWEINIKRMGLVWSRGGRVRDIEVLHED